MNYLRSRWTLAAVLFAGILPGSVYAQQISKKTADNGARLTVKGMVIDSAGNYPLEAVTLQFIAAGYPVQTALTAKDGTFLVVIPGAQEYTLTISYSGYKTWTIKTPVVRKDSVFIPGTIKMSPAEATLGAVIVTGKKSLIQNKGDKLVYNAAADISNVSGSAADVLRKAPMVVVDANGEVRMRGSSNIRVLLNGMPSGIIAKNLKEALKMIPANTIEAIEVITSPSAKYEAEGAAGIINIITKKLKGSNTNITLSAGNLEQSLSANSTITNGKFTHSLSAFGSLGRSLNYSELNRQALSKDAPIDQLVQHKDQTEKERSVYGAYNAEFHPDSLQTISAGVAYWHETWPRTSSLFSFYTNKQDTLQYNQRSRQGDLYHYFEYALNYSRKFNRKHQELKFAGMFDHSKGKADYETSQWIPAGTPFFREVSPNRSKDHTFQAQLDYTHPLNRSGRNLLETGVRYSRTGSSSAYAVFNNTGNPGSGDLLHDAARSDTMKYYQAVYAAYLSFSFKTKNRWEFRPGLRFEGTKLGADFRGPAPAFRAAFQNVVPTLLVTKKLNEHHDIRLNYTERIRRPWIWDLNPYVDASDPRNLTSGNPELRPEKTRIIELGHGYTSDEGLSLNSSVYYGFNRNAIESLTTVDSSGISRTTSMNIASNNRAGGNINAYIPLSNAWTVSAGVEYFHVWFKSSGLNVRNNGSFYSFEINSSYILPRDYTIQVSGNYNNGNVTLQGRSTANYNYQFAARKDLWNKKAGITIGLVNIFDNAMRQKSYAGAASFNSYSFSRYYNRAFTIAFNWKFGNLRKAAGSNDDDDNSSENAGMPSRGGRKH